jgi:hypothetical protein
MNTVEEIRALQKEMKEAVQSREASAAACIRGLTAEVGVAQAVVDALPAAQDASKAQKAVLEGEKEERSEILASLNKDIADARQNVECMEAESIDVEEKAKGVEHASTEQAPRVLHALSLYANITGIRWKYEDDENSHLIRGCTYRGEGGGEGGRCIGCVCVMDVPMWAFLRSFTLPFPSWSYPGSVLVAHQLPLFLPPSLPTPPVVSLPSKDEVREFSLDCTKESTFKIANSIWDMIDP